MRLSRRHFLKEIGLTVAALGAKPVDGCLSPKEKSCRHQQKHSSHDIFQFGNIR
ncbi:twin-arginine translocation signal domain-containing protein [Planctomycetota bacterium]